MTDEEILGLIEKLQNGEGEEAESSEWIDELEKAIPCPGISDLIFFGDDDDTPEDILRKARQYKPIRTPPPAE